MTATLEELKRLNAAHRRGDVDSDGYSTRRRAVIANIEEAEFSDDLRAENATSPHDIPDVGRMAVFLAACLAVGTLLGAWLFRDVWLALTLAVTALAALTVRAFTRLD